MKVTSILIGTAALLANVVFAAAEEERQPEYVVKTVVHAHVQTTENNRELIKRAACARNNCLRALAARTNLARHFCESYTNTIATSVDVFSQCHSPNKLSSACSCEWPPSAALVHMRTIGAICTGPFLRKECHAEAWDLRLGDHQEYWMVDSEDLLLRGDGWRSAYLWQ
ncbi:hypothetical protein B0H66DRAFT_587929 [Apodospora peruviana]|uniref:Uncharacterized protein n=1 Tax=Apodospora peruviana TaxID=516989 RepID=A0AAE0IHG0_9PEZI|nr:hypothetical protein B0H66DRAFT_587929 [Apodospora peruviana]